MEWPPFVLPLEDIEIVSFERVAHGLRNFDMVFVFQVLERDFLSRDAFIASSNESYPERQVTRLLFRCPSPKCVSSTL